MKELIIGMGEALWDVLPEGKKIGGAPANFAFHVSQFGFESRVLSAVGNDALGQEILDVFDQKNVKYILPKVSYPTGTVQVTLDEKGIPNYEIKEGVAWDHIPFTSELEALAKQTRAICFGSLAQRNVESRNTINRFLDAIPVGDDRLKIFDINLRQHYFNEEILVNSLRKCNVLKINDEEILVVSKLFGYEESEMTLIAERILKEFDLKMVILTCGVNGSYVFTVDGESFQSTPVVTVADTVGAGDSFTGTFCAALLKGKSIREAHRLAVAVSAYVCTQHGAMPELPANLLF